VLAWDVTCLVFIGLCLQMMGECDLSRIRARAASQDEGNHVVLLIAIAAAAASIGAIAGELSFAKQEHGGMKGVRVALGFLTVAASWMFVQTIFALHYAHEYYADDDGDGPEPQRGGLLFPGDEPPDYWDFFHFACIIGVACQTADIAFTSKTMRRTGTLHGLVAFTFNTVVLALTINLLAGLF
jgi:uncharacterized membrane protein